MQKRSNMTDCIATIPCPNDIEIRKLDYTESKNLYEFDKSLGNENKGFYRVIISYLILFEL